MAVADNQSIWLNELTSREFAAWLSSGGGLAVVPVGSVECMGAHLPLLSNVYVAEAASLAIARQGLGLCVPSLPYSTLYDTMSLTGSVHVEARVMHRYLYDLVRELRANGFDRIVIVGAMAELYYLVHEFFQNEGFAPAWADTKEIPVEGAKGRNERVTWLVAGALELAGRRDVLERLVQKNAALYGMLGPPARDREPFAGLRALGKVGYALADGEYDIQPVSRIDSAAGVAALESWAAGRAEALKSLGEYAGYLSRRRADRGIR